MSDNKLIIRDKLNQKDVHPIERNAPEAPNDHNNNSLEEVGKADARSLFCVC